jgi:hypothetical protein
VIRYNCQYCGEWALNILHSVFLVFIICTCTYQSRCVEFFFSEATCHSSRAPDFLANHIQLNEMWLMIPRLRCHPVFLFWDMFAAPARRGNGRKCAEAICIYLQHMALLCCMLSRILEFEQRKIFFFSHQLWSHRRNPIFVPYSLNRNPADFDKNHPRDSY